MLKIMADDPLLRELSINDFLSYLHETNWKRVEYPSDRLIVYERYENGGTEPDMLALPKYNTFSDSYSRLANAINLLADIEDLSPYKIIQKILSLDNDTLNMRMLLPPGIFPSLEKATQIVQGLRDLVAYSACMEKEPKPFFNKQLPEGLQQAQLCRFGHTFSGSFGFTIKSPVYTLQPPLLGLPMSRKVVERIIRGLNFAHQAEQEKNSAVISQTFEKGLNSNMCSALAAISINLQETDIEYTVSWSPRLPASDDLIEIGTVYLPGSAYHYLTEAAATLKEEVSEPSRTIELEERPETQVRGTIIQLKSGKKDDRTVTVLTEDRGPIHISLERETYQFACDAHRDSQPISVKGKLTKRGRSWYLEHPHDFVVELSQ